MEKKKAVEEIEWDMDGVCMCIHVCTCVDGGVLV